MSIQSLRNGLERLKGRKFQIDKELNSLNTEISDSKIDLSRHEQAREIMREVGLKTQQQMQFHVSDIVSMALNSVFPDPYEMKVEFVQRRNKTECDLMLKKKDGQLIDPMDSSGGGVVDIAAFALRIASWSIANPKTRNVIIMDEPMRFLSVDYQEKASQMIKEISTKLGIQFIIVTHESTLASYADKVFEVSQNKITGISKVI